MLAALVGFLGDFDLAEEAAQEAFAIAAERWPRDGAPANPGAWLDDDRPQPRDRPHPARPHASRRRRACSRSRKPMEDELDETTIPDERLELFFTCCHPALALEAQVALTLRALGGLSTEEIARAFLVASRDDEAQRLVARQGKIPPPASPSASRPPICCPTGSRRCSAVVYLIFNEGYGGRGELAAEAIRLGRVLAELMPDEPEVQGLLALMLLHDARRDARFAAASSCCSPTRTARCWDAAKIARRARRARPRARRSRGRGPYVLQAAIASLHCEEPIDWARDRRALRRAARADRLARRRAEPRGRGRRGRRRRGRARAVEAIDLDGYHYLHSTRAELLRRLGRPEEARAAYRRAIELSREGPERRFLERKLAEL